MREPARLIAVLLLAASSAVAQQSGNEILSVIRAYDSAWARKDLAEVERLLSPEFVYFSSKGDVMPRKRMLSFLKEPSYSLAQAARSELEVYARGDTAVASSRWRGSGSFQGKKFTDDQRCSLVLAREAGAWRLRSEHCTQIAH